MKALQGYQVPSKLPCYYCGERTDIRKMTPIPQKYWGNWYQPRKYHIPLGKIMIPVCCAQCKEEVYEDFC